MKRRLKQLVAVCTSAALILTMSLSFTGCGSSGIDSELSMAPDVEKYLEKYKNPHAFIKSDTDKYIVVELPVEISKGITSVEGYAETYGGNKKVTEKEL